MLAFGICIGIGIGIDIDALLHSPQLAAFGFAVRTMRCDRRKRGSERKRRKRKPTTPSCLPKQSGRSRSRRSVCVSCCQVPNATCNSIFSSIQLPMPMPIRMLMLMPMPLSLSLSLPMPMQQQQSSQDSSTPSGDASDKTSKPGKTLNLKQYQAEVAKAMAEAEREAAAEGD